MRTRFTFALVTALAFSCAHANMKAMSDDEIREDIVLGELKSFQGECPCPYSQDSDGRTCGNNSAYYTQKGSIRCYREDIAISEVNSYRLKNSIVDPNFVPENAKSESFKKFQPPPSQWAPYDPGKAPSYP